MDAVTAICGALLSVSVATNVIVFFVVRSWARYAATDPVAALEQILSQVKAFRGHTLVIDDEGRVDVLCDGCAGEHRHSKRHAAKTVFTRSALPAKCPRCDSVMGWHRDVGRCEYCGYPTKRHAQD